jgi:hypothetical protein
MSTVAGKMYPDDEVSSTNDTVVPGMRFDSASMPVGLVRDAVEKLGFQG